MKKEYVIVFHNGLSYEDYESKVSQSLELYEALHHYTKK